MAPTLTLADLEGVVRASWGPDTCDPADLDSWRPDNPARGQCGVTALVLHDLLGGELILGEVHVTGAKVGYHYWNRFAGVVEVDLTREQFRAEEIVSGGKVVVRPAGPPKRCREQYETLRDRVLASLRVTPGTATDVRM
ncbi:YunG family protein [Fodinicola acaciae]|uniref:YunG family protein n=1 Tax=Fodinicola acaciae TaxID=2681555 RepID=UPI0013D27466|nr:hypothetical protein [Fodinicola acaciae]